MPTERVRRKTLPTYETPSEVHRMMESCTCERDALLIQVLFASGARISEVLAIRVGDITKTGLRMPNLKQSVREKLPDGTSRHIRVDAEKHVFLHPHVLTQLREYTQGMAPTAPLFGRLSDGKSMTRKRAWQIVKAAASKAGIFKRRYGTDLPVAAWPHSLRHSCATNLLDNGAPITLVQEQLGHSSLSSTQVYARLSNARTAEIIAGIPF